MRGRTRFVQRVTADAPPGSTRLTDENFDAGADGDVPDTSNTSADATTGASTLSLTDEWSAEGPVSLSIAGTAQHYLTFNTDDNAVAYPVHDTHYLQMYIEYDQQPAETAWLLAVLDGSGNVATRIGITATSTAIISDGE